MKTASTSSNRLWSEVPVKYTIAMVLIVLLLIIMSVVGWFFASQERAAIMRGREQLSNSIGIQTSVMLSKHQYGTIEKTLGSIVGCNHELQSAAVRTAEGDIRVAVGDHEKHWVADLATRPAETQIATPLRLGSGTWGHLEFRFQPIHAERPLGAWFDPHYAFLSLLMLVTAILVPYYLGILLKQFDLSKAVPRQIEGAFDTLAEGLMLTDPKGNIRSANKTFSDWVGAPAELLKGNKPDSLGCALSETGVGKPASGLTPWEEVSLSGEPVHAASMRLCNPKTGATLSLIANSTPIKGANGVHVGVLTSFQDLTDLEKKAVELEKAKQSADTVKNSRNKLLTRMSHEIRTSMNAILGFSQIIEAETQDPELQQHLQTIHQRGESLITLSDDMLELSNLESGKIQLENRPTSIFQIVDEVLSKQSVLAKEKGIYLRSQMPGKLPESVVVDTDRLRQSLTNLVGNAIEYTSTGGVTLETMLVQQPGSTKPLLSFKVTDTGTGMTSEAQEAVFRPFYEANDSAVCSIDGTDFRFAICKQLARRMGGDLAFESQLGTGSVFQQVIDIGDISGVELVSNGVIERNARGRAGQVVDLPPMNILIVDDGETNREILSVYFKRENVTFEQAENGQEAVEMVNAGDFDIVLMDMQMPIMDGFEATKTLRSQGYELPIIALTANAMEEDKRACLKAGCSGFLAKPTERERLFTELSLAVTGDVTWRDKPQPKKRPKAESVPADELSDGNDGFIGSTLPMDDEDFIEVAELFLSGLRKKVGLMVTALDNADFVELSSLGHWLKGAAGSAGYGPLTPAGRELEQGSKDEDLDACFETIREITEMAARARVVPDLPPNA